MRLCLVFLFLFSMVSLISFSQTGTEPVGKPATITGIEEDDQYISVFTTPGQTYNHCPKGKKCKPAIGWLDRNAKIRVIGEPEKHLTKELHTDEIVQDEFRKIQFEYDRSGIHQQGEGYIPNDYVSMTKTKPLYSVTQPKIEKKPCPPKTNDKALTQIEETLKPLTPPIQNTSFIQQADEISKIVGFCPLSPADKAPKNLPEKTNMYDHFIKNNSRLSEKNVPQILAENNQLMTQQNLIEIDSLSRTMYAEMASCYRSGLQYPMAVAKIILNRTEKKSRHKEFIKPPHEMPKPDVAKVCTSPSQFNCWMKQIAGVKNNTLHHALCPPQKENTPFWNGKVAPKYETDLWKNSVRIATEAILHPNKFDKRTSDINVKNGNFFYTSGMGKFFNMKQRKDYTVDGNPLDKSRCLEIWTE